MLPHDAAVPAGYLVAPPATARPAAASVMDAAASALSPASLLSVRGRDRLCLHTGSPYHRYLMPQINKCSSA
jgi:hypothetical protein